MGRLLEQEKNSFREQIQTIKKNISASEQFAATEVITKKLIQLEEFVTSHVVCVYAALSDEVNTNQIIDTALSQGKTVVIPKIVGTYTLLLYAIDSRKDLKPQRYGIPEPSQHSLQVDPKTVDLFIIPGVAFNLRGHRLGRGKGMYDRLLEHISTPIIGLSYDQQIVPSLPHDSYDRVMSVIITEKKIVHIH